MWMDGDSVGMEEKCWGVGLEDFYCVPTKNLHLGVGMPVSAIPESQHLKGDVKTLSSTVSQENSSGKTVET